MQYLSYVVAGTLAVGGMVFVGCDHRKTASNNRSTNSDNARTVADKQGPMERAGEKMDRAMERATDRLTPAARPVGAVKDLAPDYEDIRGVLAKFTDDAMTAKGESDLVGYFASFDKTRLKDFAADQNNFADLNDKIERLRNSWKAKYGHDFKIGDKDVVFAEDKVWIVQAEIGDSAKLASGKLTGPNAELRADIDRRITQGAARPGATDASKSEKKEAKELNDVGRNIAMVTFTGIEAQPQLQVPMIHEMLDQWRIDVPDTIDGPELRDNLSSHLSMVESSVDKWPANESDAYRMVAYHVLGAVMDAGGNTK